MQAIYRCGPGQILGWKFITISCKIGNIRDKRESLEMKKWLFLFEKILYSPGVSMIRDSSLLGEFPAQF
jgi:hypothetical protein